MSAPATNTPRKSAGALAINSLVDRLAFHVTRRALGKFDAEHLRDIGLSHSDLRSRDFNRVWRDHIL